MSRPIPYPFPNLTMSKPIFTIVEEDIQSVASQRVGRQLTPDEMRSAIHYFENGIQWWETAECAVDLAVDDHKPGF